MEKKLTFLGIETSCDETAASIVQENKDGAARILSSVVSSQIKEHEKFGGVVPELAARSHIENIEFIVSKAFKEADVKIDEISGVAATAGPGLIVCLTVGLNFGKAIAGFADKPFVAVNHLEGHALSPGLSENIKFPYLLLLISGGHTQFLIVENINQYKQLGTTIDDALGEAFDKTAKMLDLGYPGGPAVEKFAKKGDKNYFKLKFLFSKLCLSKSVYQDFLYYSGCNFLIVTKTFYFRSQIQIDLKDFLCLIHSTKMC